MVDSRTETPLGPAVMPNCSLKQESFEQESLPRDEPCANNSGYPRLKLIPLKQKAPTALFQRSITLMRSIFQRLQRTLEEAMRIKAENRVQSILMDQQPVPVRYGCALHTKPNRNL